MSAREPTILATSGGYRTPDHGDREFTPLVRYAAELSGAQGRPKFCHLGTANGDQRSMAGIMSEAAHKAGFDWVNLNLFAEPTFRDVEEVLCSQDVIWVNGGSVVNLLAVWRAHGLHRVLRRAWESGVVLAGISAGSLCWFQGGPTDSFGPPLRTITDGLSFLPYGNGVHYDSEDDRRSRVHHDIEDGVFDEVHCTDDGAGLMYHRTELTDAVADVRGAKGYIVRLDDNRPIEEPLPTRQL